MVGLLAEGFCIRPNSYGFITHPKFSILCPTILDFILCLWTYTEETFDPKKDFILKILKMNSVEIREPIT